MAWPVAGGAGGERQPTATGSRPLLRINDAARIELDCVVRDHQNAPYLRYYNHKMRREAFVPIDDELADEIRHQQEAVPADRPAATCLFPQAKSLDGTKPRRQPFTPIGAWQDRIGLRDELGRPFRFTAHQLRHTYGTRLINADVPQEVVRRLLDHESPEMTARYARLRDDTIRRHWERARKVNIAGETIILEAGTPLSDAAWMKENLGRATMALLLRSSAAADLPARQRLSDLPGVHHHPGLPQRAPRSVARHETAHRHRRSPRQ
jgi:hypothetical protein